MGQSTRIGNTQRPQTASRSKRQSRLRAHLLGGSVASATLWIAALSHAEVVAYWSLNTLNPLAAPTIAADIGKGSVDASGLGIDAQVYQGTAMNAESGFTAGTALGLAGMSANGSRLDVAIDTVGYTDLSISLASRRSATGFTSVTLQYWRGDFWTDIEMYSPNALNWEVRTIDLSTLDGLEDGIALLRFTFDGATGSTGSARIDNLSLTGSVVPAPAALGLFACAVARGNRRRPNI